MAAEKRFTDKPLSVNSTPEIRERIKRVAEEDHVSENAVARWLWANPVTLDLLAGVDPEGLVFDPEEGEQVRRYRVPRDA